MFRGVCKIRKGSVTESIDLAGAAICMGIVPGVLQVLPGKSRGSTHFSRFPRPPPLTRSAISCFSLFCFVDFLLLWCLVFGGSFRENLTRLSSACWRGCIAHPPSAGLKYKQGLGFPALFPPEGSPSLSAPLDSPSTFPQPPPLFPPPSRGKHLSINPPAPDSLPSLFLFPTPSFHSLKPTPTPSNYLFSPPFSSIPLNAHPPVISSSTHP